LESSEEILNGKEQEAFLEFVRCMLQWRPEDRMTAKQLLDHPLLKDINLRTLYADQGLRGIDKVHMGILQHHCVPTGELRGTVRVSERS
jgi:serine/threonine protein kinase